jgi:hypothetical protein
MAGTFGARRQLTCQTQFLLDIWTDSPRCRKRPLSLSQTTPSTTSGLIKGSPPWSVQVSLASARNHRDGAWQVLKFRFEGPSDAPAQKCRSPSSSQYSRFARILDRLVDLDSKQVWIECPDP